MCLLVTHGAYDFADNPLNPTTKKHGFKLFKAELDARPVKAKEQSLTSDQTILKRNYIYK